MKNKVLTISLIILVCITLLGVIALILLFNWNKVNSNAEPTIDQIIEASVDVPEITTNLAGRQFILFH